MIAVFRIPLAVAVPLLLGVLVATFGAVASPVAHDGRAAGSGGNNNGGGDDPPFPLPITYAVSSEAHGGRRIAFFRGGAYRLTTNVRCVAAPCPEAGGLGTWAYRAADRTLTFTHPVEKAAARGGAAPPPSMVATQAWRIGRAAAAAAPRSRPPPATIEARLVGAQGDASVALEYPIKVARDRTSTWKLVRDPAAAASGGSGDSDVAHDHYVSSGGGRNQVALGGDDN